MYCIKCGAKLADTEKKCPLCQTMVFHPELEQPEAAPLYPAEKLPAPEVTSRTAQIIVATAFLQALLISLVCDLQLNHTITWAGFVIGGLVLAYLTVFLPGWFRRPNPVIFIPCDFVAAALYLLYIDLAVGGRWFLSFAFPVTGFACLIATTMVLLLRYLRRGKLYVIGGGIIALGAFMPVMELLLCITFPGISFIGWGFYPMVALVLLGGMLIFLAICRPARQTMERKFFI